MSACSMRCVSGCPLHSKTMLSCCSVRLCGVSDLHNTGCLLTISQFDPDRLQTMCTERSNIAAVPSLEVCEPTAASRSMTDSLVRFELFCRRQSSARLGHCAAPTRCRPKSPSHGAPDSEAKQIALRHYLHDVLERSASWPSTPLMMSSTSGTNLA